MTQPASISEAALIVLRERYFRRDEAGRPSEDVSGMFGRVAAAIAEPGRAYGDDVAWWAERFLARMQRREFLPNSPTLMNAGTAGGQLAACFVLPVEDDLGSIFTALSQMARIHQSGGGTGFSFSALRPRDDRVRSTGGISSGPLSFIDLFDRTTAVIRAGGRRRGANMAVLRIDHPDIEEFIAAKRTPGRLENFNLSVGITDAFLAALDSDAVFPLRNPRGGTVVREVDPRRLFEAIVDAAWAVGDPGLLFLDEINRHNQVPALGLIEATNPCGEQPLLAYESCTLGSINLATFAGATDVEWDRLADAIRDGVVFLDNVIDANGYPFPEIEAATRRTRKVGLGVMGLADLFARLGLAYDSAEALSLADRTAQFVTDNARRASAELGERRGSFPAFGRSVWPQRGFTAMRNAAVTCVAPTGTLSLIAGVAGGIEPFFALATVRRLLDGQRFTEINQALANVRTALEISPEIHLRMQAAFQRHVDAAVSKTVNLPADAPPAAVRDAFLLARRLQLKGVTVYRYGSRRGQPLSAVEEDSPADCRDCAV